MPAPAITPLARRLAEDAGVAWHTLTSAEGGPITERDVLAHLTEVTRGNGPAQTNGPAEALDFSSLAASLAEAVQELWVVPGEAVTEDQQAQASTPESLELKGLKPEDAATPAPGSLEHLQAQLAAERLAHAQTRRLLSTLEETVKQQSARAAQLKPLSAEIRRLGSALGVANAEMERLRPLEKLVDSLQKQLEEARADEASVRLLCRGLQAQQDRLEERKRSRWQFWRRAS